MQKEAQPGKMSRRAQILTSRLINLRTVKVQMDGATTASGALTSADRDRSKSPFSGNQPPPVAIFPGMEPLGACFFPTIPGHVAFLARSE